MIGTLKNRMLKFAEFWKVQRAELSVVLHPPHWNRKPEPIDIEDCSEVYGDNVIPMFPEVKTRCMSAANYPNDCVYSVVDNFRRCKFCGQPSGLDR